MEEALLRDDAADQEGDQQDDRHRLPADAVEVMHRRGERRLRGRSSTRSSAALSAPNICQEDVAGWPEGSTRGAADRVECRMSRLCVGAAPAPAGG